MKIQHQRFIKVSIYADNNRFIANEWTSDAEFFLAEQFNERRQRSLSLGMRPKPTNEDIHLELLEKLKEPNRSLVPVGRRTIPVFNPPPLPEWMNIFNEFQEKITERKTKQNE